MKVFKTLLVDDERLAREEMKSLLKDFVQIEIIDEAKNGEEAIEKIKVLKPDLVFLDISMPDMSGFDLLKQLDEIPQVIFVSAYDQYALKAFEANALDYLLKPVDPQRLEESIKKIQSKEEFESTLTIENDRKNRTLGQGDQIFIKDGEKCYFITLEKVRYFESEGNYVKVYFDQSRPMLLRSLNALEERLNPNLFFRANRKFIINLQQIVHVENWFNGGLMVTMSNEEKIEISRRQAIRFKDIFSL